jgi:hypothetical protein
MATYTEPASVRTALTTSAMNSLASETYVSCGTIDLSAVDPTEIVIEVGATPGTVSGNKQLVVFAKASFDNTNFTTGPESGTTTTDEPVLYVLGVLPLPTNSTAQRKSFPVKAAIGFIPPHLEIVAKNDSGAALAASGHDVYYSTYTGNGA